MPRMSEANTHVDLLDWLVGLGFICRTRAVVRIVHHLSARRAGSADPGEATGLLTHHLVHDAACWVFIDELLARTRRHPAARWLAAREIF